MGLIKILIWVCFYYGTESFDFERKYGTFKGQFKTKFHIIFTQPRSGSTWLSDALANHPCIVNTNEFPQCECLTVRYALLLISIVYLHKLKNILL